MPAYLILDAVVTDSERYADYRRGASTAEDYGGRVLARAPDPELLEQGDWQPSRVVVMEFPDVDAARAWYRSDAYQEKAQIRHEAARSTLILIDGRP